MYCLEPCEIAPTNPAYKFSFLSFLFLHFFIHFALSAIKCERIKVKLGTHEGLNKALLYRAAQYDDIYHHARDISV